MRYSYITILSALFLSSVAIYFSVAGLAAIFAAYAIPVIIMGVALELGKLVTAVWLHRYWHSGVKWWLKAYLSVAILGLMLLTSMGIFGFLSKSHVEQTALSTENIALIANLKGEIARNKAIIDRSREKIAGFEKNGSGVDASINTQIDKEQKRIESAYNRVKPDLQAQKDILEMETKRTKNKLLPYQSELFKINSVLESIENALREGDVKLAQRLIGSREDGIYGRRTIKALKAFREQKEKRKKEILAEIKKIENTRNPKVDAALNEIKRIRDSVQTEIDHSNELINRYRKRLGSSTKVDIEQLIINEESKIKKANEEIDKLIQKKLGLESQYRKLVAEVGPIKYIAEMVYSNNPDQNILEKAVRWVIILIIFFFDPLAVGLLLAAQYSLEHENKGKKNGKLAQLVSAVVESKEETDLEEQEKPPSPSQSLNTTVSEIEKINDSYFMYNNKMYEKEALIRLHPEVTDLLAKFDEEEGHE